MSNQALMIKDDMSMMDLGNVLAKSGYFQDARDAAQAVVKVLAGREMGFGPVASMTGINIIKGRVSMGSNLIAAAVKRSGRYDYRVKVMTADECTIEFFERVEGKRELIGVSTFTIADARKAQTQNLDKFPRNMLFARAMSNGSKWFCADVFGGPIYTPDELGEMVNEEGEIIDQTVTATRTEQQRTELSDPTSTSPIDATTTPTPNGKPKIASIKFNSQTVEEWKAASMTFVIANPNWAAKNGLPDMGHIQASAGHSGYTYIDGDNRDEVFSMIKAAHESKQADAA